MIDKFSKASSFVYNALWGPDTVFKKSYHITVAALNTLLLTGTSKIYHSLSSLAYWLEHNVSKDTTKENGDKAEMIYDKVLGTAQNAKSSCLEQTKVLFEKNTWLFLRYNIDFFEQVTSEEKSSAFLEQIFKTISEDIDFPNELKWPLQENQRKTFNEQLCCFEKLMKGVHDYSLKQLCAAIDPNYKKLMLSKAQKTFDKLVLNNKKITSLNVNGEGFFYLPEEIGKLTCLTHLQISGTRINVLPKTIGNLTKLTHLDLSWNQFKELPQEIEHLQILTVFNLSGNQIQQIPTAIGSLTSLTALFLSKNSLKELPSTIKNLTGLTWLDLSENQFETLPAAIGNLSSLLWHGS
jgi:Leucine-rich repeat (LRR) protein